MSDDIEQALAAFDQRTLQHAADVEARADETERLRTQFEELRSALIRPQLRAVADQLVAHGHIADVHAGGSGSIGPFVELTTTRMGRPEMVQARLTYRFLLDDGRVSVESMVGDREGRSTESVADVTSASIQADAHRLITNLLA